MRVLLVNAHGADTTVGGAEAYVEQLARGLPSLGVDVELLAAFPERSPTGLPAAVLHARDWRDDPTRRLRNHAGDVLARPGRRLADLVAASRPDVVHTGNLPGISTAVWEVSRRLGAAVVHSLHDYHLLCPRVTLVRPSGEACRPHPLLCGLRMRRLARWAPAVGHVIGVSHHVLDRHRAIFPHATTHVIRHPFEPPAARSFVRPAGPLATLGYLGSLESTKGVGELLAAAPGLARAGVRLRIAGDGRLRAAVEAAADGHTLAYDGRVSGPDKEAFLRRCDLGVVPSTWEEPGGPTYTVLDWLSAGRPVLVSPRGGLAEALPSLPGARVVEPTASGIVSAVERLLDQDAWHEAVERVQPVDTGGRERWLAEHERVYRAALEDRR